MRPSMFDTRTPHTHTHTHAHTHTHTMPTDIAHAHAHARGVCSLVVLLRGCSTHMIDAAAGGHTAAVCLLVPASSTRLGCVGGVQSLETVVVRSKQQQQRSSSSSSRQQQQQQLCVSRACVRAHLGRRNCCACVHVHVCLHMCVVGHGRGLSWLFVVVVF